MSKKRISKSSVVEFINFFNSLPKRSGPGGKFIELIAMIILASVLHELGHIVMGGGVRDFRYPGPDMLSTVVIVHNGTLLSEISGFLFTLPLLLVSNFPRLLFLFLLFQSRYDLMDVAEQLKLSSIHIGWPAPM